MPQIAGIHFREHRGGRSSKTPIIFVHGAGLDSHIWPYPLWRLENYWTFIIDLPGHGYSKSVCCLTIQAYANGLIDLVNGLGLDRATFAGLDIGGAILMDLCLRFPDRVHGLFLINTCLQYNIPASAIQFLKEKQYRSGFTEILTWGNQRDKRASIVPRLETIVNAQRKSVLAADIFLMEYYRCHSPLECFKNTSVRFIFSTNDRLLGWKYEERMRELLSEDHAYVHIADRGHWLPYEDPQSVKSHLMEFLTDLGLD